MPRPIVATIDSAALAHNLHVARWYAPKSRVMAVVKANAYGHGMLRAAQALREADAFGVVDIAAGEALRGIGYAHPIVLLEGFFAPGDLHDLARHRLTPVVHNDEQLSMIDRPDVPRLGAAFVKINTGMNRLGFPPSEAARVVRRLVSAGVADLTLMTHFACADEDDGVAAQLSRFAEATAALDYPKSLANSAAILRHPSTHADWVRPGIMLYGATPCSDTAAAAFGLAPAMTLASEITAVRDLTAGEHVGYGATFTAPGPMRVGVVACGYADGYPRHAPSGTPVLVAGRRCGTVGRVSMDMLCVDLTEVPEAGVGTAVVMWGNGLPVDDVAAAAGTIGYELLCALAPRVPIRYV